MNGTDLFPLVNDAETMFPFSSSEFPVELLTKLWFIGADWLEFSCLSNSEDWRKTLNWARRGSSSNPLVSGSKLAKETEF